MIKPDTDSGSCRLLNQEGIKAMQKKHSLALEETQISSDHSCATHIPINHPTDLKFFLLQ